MFKGSKFAKEARKRGITDQDLCDAVAQVIASPKSYSLGGEVYKKRLNDNMDRSIILAKGGKHWFYVHLFQKSDRDNISREELEMLKELAKANANLSDKQLTAAIDDGQFEEICNEIES